jgi:hypothetical protein
MLVTFDYLKIRRNQLTEPFSMAIHGEALTVDASKGVAEWAASLRSSAGSARRASEPHARGPLGLDRSDTAGALRFPVVVSHIVAYGCIRRAHEMLDREEAIRSKSPTAVTQELWGVFLAYNLVRLDMERAAKDAGVEPTRISFVAALRLICDEWLWCAVATPGAIPRHLRNLRAEWKTLILPPRRPKRSYPRAVKIKRSNYARKRGTGSKRSDFFLIRPTLGLALRSQTRRKAPAASSYGT